jgi:Transposase zinc-ribbon domain
MKESYPRTLIELEDRTGRAFFYGMPVGNICLRYGGPDGFVCPACGGKKCWGMDRNLWLCGGCRRQVSVTSGTIFQDNRIP